MLIKFNRIEIIFEIMPMHVYSYRAKLLENGLCLEQTHTHTRSMKIMSSLNAFSYNRSHEPKIHVLRARGIKGSFGFLLSALLFIRTHRHKSIYDCIRAHAPMVEIHIVAVITGE